MITTLALAALSVVPDANVDFGYGRIASRVGKPSSEMVRLRMGAATESRLQVSFGASATVPTTLPASLGMQLEVTDTNSTLWLHGDISHTTKNFVFAVAAGWYIFGTEVQLRNTNRGLDVVVLGKISFSPTTILRALGAAEREQ
jgi:hypothetical protein